MAPLKSFVITASPPPMNPKLHRAKTDITTDNSIEGYVRRYSRKTRLIHCMKWAFCMHACLANWETQSAVQLESIPLDSG